MSLVCSLAGHDWGEERVETERDEARGQVAVTEREYRECTRCGERRIISENTEVRPTADNREETDETPVKETEASDAQTEMEEEEKSTFAPSDGFDTDETEDAAIIEDTEMEGVTEPGEVEGDEDGVQSRVRESTGAEVTRETTPDGDEDYVCPDCGFSTSDPSLRAGDICPDCGGYLEET
ncbi:hypothetical protein EGH25_01405 [Haladaptatus sp. F3-133]|jgi:DNA-directed RNA polymerase subunit RPC12/RpoP|uniref:Uncharacterized protein n=1 Tax=Halorutilus salinus TaxID=2487751 RepID=A0A9Q4GFC6_9EURY|nr:hypothetical protein [Halorutilus salinus]MCX2818014.1 hypothetical protein [Halorutilus salinus]